MSRCPAFAAVAAAAVLACIGACGPSNAGDVNPQTYAKAVCGALLAWKQGVAGDSARLSQEVQARSLDVRTVKAGYTAFFQGVVRRTDALLTRIERAGAPKVDNGSGYATDLRAALAQARSGLATARARFAGLPTGDLRSYAAGAATIRDQLGQVFVGVGTALDRLSRTYPDKALNSAFEREPDCKSLT